MQLQLYFELTMLLQIDKYSSSMFRCNNIIIHVFAILKQTLASKASSTRPNDALALGAYASLLTNKFKRKQSQAASYNSASSLVHHHYQTTELPTYRLGPLSKQTVRWVFHRYQRTSCHVLQPQMFLRLSYTRYDHLLQHVMLK